ncbi:MAG: adenine deaminase C-terminal domain-containing protein [Vicinamibacterales bacterium]
MALGEAFADVVILGGRVLSVHTGTFTGDGIAIKGNRIAALGDVDYTIGSGTEVIDASGQTLVPGLVSPHVHQWHSGQNGTVWAQCHLLAGTTAAADGFYGCGIIAGVRGIRFFLDEVLRTPLKLLFLVPTLCYAQTRAFGFPVTPEAPTAEETLEMLTWSEALGLEETGYELLLQPDGRRDPDMVRIVEQCLAMGKVVTGHGPSFASERELNAYLAAGFTNNHEIVSVEEATRQAELGMHILLRDAPALHDLPQAVRAVTERRQDARAFQICPDLATAKSLFEGQIDVAIRTAIRCGLDPIRALQMATIQPAEYFRVSEEIGSIAPGRFADIVFLDDLRDFTIRRVIADGERVVEDGKLVKELPKPDYPDWLYETFHLSRSFSAEDFHARVPVEADEATVRVIAITETSIDSAEEHHVLPVHDGVIQADAAHGINKVVVLDRLHGRAEYGVGFVRGFSLRAGAIGQTVNFNQCVVAVGVDDSELACAVNEMVARRGGYVAVRDGRILAELATPLLGQASDLPYEPAKARAEAVAVAWRDLGCAMESPMTQLEFVCASTMPTLRLSHLGLSRVSLDESGGIDLKSYGVVPLVVTTG